MPMLSEKKKKRAKKVAKETFNWLQRRGQAFRRNIEGLGLSGDLLMEDKRRSVARQPRKKTIVIKVNGTTIKVSRSRRRKRRKK